MYNFEAYARLILRGFLFRRLIWIISDRQPTFGCNDQLYLPYQHSQLVFRNIFPVQCSIQSDNTSGDIDVK